MATTDLPTADERRAMMESVVDDVRDSPHLDVSHWCPHGEEHYIGDMDGGTYWKPAHVTVTGDFTDMVTLHALNGLMNDHGLKVHTCRGYEFSEKSTDGHARLVVDHGGDA